MSPSSNATTQGGFLQGIPQVSETSALPVAASGCCGTTNQSGNTGCCGEPAAQEPVATNAPPTQGCCGEPAATIATAGQTGGCCGEPVTTLVATAGMQTGCCN